MSILVIYNPACGDCTAEQFFTTNVIPRLRAANRTPAEIVRTRAPDDAGIQTLSFLNKCEGDVTVVLGSGDGTLHEIMNHLTSATEAGEGRTVYFVLVPCGTANALYSSLFRPAPLEDTVTYRMRSVEAFLGASTPRSLSLSLTSLSLHHGDTRPVVSIVVTSTALHAAILKDSEKLRKEIPGIERFKVAAHQNITKWYSGRVKLLPIPTSGGVLTYDVDKADFVPLAPDSWDLHGPFAYFLSTMNVDRLEPEFRINPTISKIPPTSVSMDVIVVRPQRDPTFTANIPQVRESFAEKIVVVLTSAYQDGNHINLRYSQNGDITERSSGKPVVECFRCGGWEWIPDGIDQDAHLLCADGTIFEIEKGGQAVCKAASRKDMPTDFYVHV